MTSLLKWARNKAGSQLFWSSHSLTAKCSYLHSIDQASNAKSSTFQVSLLHRGSLVGLTPCSWLCPLGLSFLLCLCDLLNGQSPFETKSSNKGQLLEAHCGWNMLNETKSSDKGQVNETLCGQRLTQDDKVLQGGAVSWGTLWLKSAYNETKSSDEEHFIETPWVEVR